jgi:anti-sigma-K factor RskA
LASVMTLANLPPNDRDKRQYQLWIVDRGRMHAEPVDGGVFDVDDTGATIIAIRPALAIRDATLFAVTDEPPGGVVVSEKGKRGEFVVVMAR